MRQTAIAERILVPSAEQPHVEDLHFPDNRSAPRAWRILLAHGGLYLATLAGAVAPLPLWANILFALANGVFIALLFIIAHDGAHGAYVKNAKLNYWIARFAFLPCVHAVSLWCTIHNKLHHGYTNLKGYDGVWTPMSKREYDAASAPRRLLERVFRSPFGPFVYYYVVFWPWRTLLPLGRDVRGQWRRHMPDTAFTLAGFAATLVAIGAAGHYLTPERPLWLVLSVGWFIPYQVWNYLMAFTIYLNHTHPNIAWFDDMAKWRRHQPNLVDTTNIAMPFPLNKIKLYQDVMAHTAHHVKPTIPMYALQGAQGEINARFGTLVDYKLTPREYLRIVRTCKLFDCERMCWTDFDGRPTS